MDARRLHGHVEDGPCVCADCSQRLATDAFRGERQERACETCHRPLGSVVVDVRVEGNEEDVAAFAAKRGGGGGVRC